MTNDQLTQRVVELEAFKGKSEAEHEKFELIIAELQEDVRTTKNLAEDVREINTQILCLHYNQT